MTDKEFELLVRCVRFEDEEHLCSKCVHRIKNDRGYSYTTNVHPCEKEWNLPGFENEPMWQLEDNGSGFNVVGCDHFASFIDDPELSKQIYHNWIASDDWRRISRKKIIDAGLRCELCGTAKNLAVHHITYSHLLTEDKHQEDLIVVCKQCHESIHKSDLARKEEKKRIKDFITSEKDKAVKLHAIQEEMQAMSPEELRLYHLQVCRDEALRTLDSMVLSDNAEIIAKALKLRVAIRVAKNADDLERICEEVLNG